MKHAISTSSAAACLCLAYIAQPLAAQPLTTGTVNKPTQLDADLSTTSPAKVCLGNLHEFDDQMKKDGFRPGGWRYGYYDPMIGYPVAGMVGYHNARPGYEVRTLLNSARILARLGQEKQCQDTLATTRDVYKQYLTQIQDRRAGIADVPDWREKQIASAQPVTSLRTSLRSDEILGAEVRNAKDESLGSIDDVVMSPQTGKIAYLVVSRGGLFGIDEKYVPVPWDDFKATVNLSTLVLDVSKQFLDDAPQVKNSQLKGSGQFDQQTVTINSYWNGKAVTKINH